MSELWKECKKLIIIVKRKKIHLSQEARMDFNIYIIIILKVACMKYKQVLSHICQKTVDQALSWQIAVFGEVFANHISVWLKYTKECFSVDLHSLTVTVGWELSPRNENTVLFSFDWKKSS